VSRPLALSMTCDGTSNLGRGPFQIAWELLVYGIHSFFLSSSVNILKCEVKMWVFRVSRLKYVRCVRYGLLQGICLFF
jgi:hypothetical protein